MKEEEIKLCINDTLKLDGIVHVTGMVTCGSGLHRGKEKQAENNPSVKIGMGLEIIE